MNTPKHLNIGKAKYKLASGILAQARRDLRRFRGATNASERHLYLDAHDWVVSDSCRWPFSFRNVCRRLELTPEVVRYELLRDVSLGTCRYWSHRFGSIAGRVQIAFHQIVHRLEHTGAPSQGM